MGQPHFGSKISLIGIVSMLSLMVNSPVLHYLFYFIIIIKNNQEKRENNGLHKKKRRHMLKAGGF
jgi:hypothetical protein